MLKPDVTAFFDEATNTASYVVVDPSSTACAIVDPVLDYDPAAGRTATHSADDLLAFVASGGHEVEWVLETHVHADHLSAGDLIRERTGAKLAIGWRITEVQRIFGELFEAEAAFARDGSQFDRLLGDNERLRIGNLELAAMHTPGHTPACMSYAIGDAVFVGDTLFMPDYGTARADFPGGDATTLFHSIHRLYGLPTDTRVFLCHDYKPQGRDEFVWETTIGEERRANVHVRDGVKEADFVHMREARDATLGMPALILPSIQVNMRAGRLPPADDSGKRFLKIPLNAL